MSNAATFDTSVTLPIRRASGLLAGLRMAGFGLLSVMAAVGIGVLNFFTKDTAAQCRWYYRMIAHVFGIEVIVRGALSTAPATLIVSNHISYFDVFVLGGIIPGYFVAKAEVSSWPFIGALNRIGRTVFIDRRRTAAAGARDELQERMDAGEILIMFPEATSHDGNRVRPFKSALFTVTEGTTQGGRPVTVQPVSIAYTRLNGVPMGIGWRSFFAWYGDMDLMPHVWYALKLGTLTAEVTFHPPVTIADFGNRKDLAAYCTQACSAGVARLLAGRDAA
jgi:1-acyl-sn-glycerol-3-phosphate acyltransferase